MAHVWQHDTENSWTLRGDSGEILAVVTAQDDEFRTSGPFSPGEDVFSTLDEAQGAVQQIRDEELA